MQFLRSIFWGALAIVLAGFCARNWTPVTVNLWSDLVMDTRLALPVLVAFLLGLLPYFVLHRTTRWALQRKLHQSERQLAELRALITPEKQETSSSGAIPPSAAPIAVPPGVS
ncbi:MAG: LapA family protein [Chakrabartia sp.]